MTQNWKTGYSCDIYLKIYFRIFSLGLEISGLVNIKRSRNWYQDLAPVLERVMGLNDCVPVSNEEVLQCNPL